MNELRRFGLGGEKSKNVPLYSAEQMREKKERAINELNRAIEEAGLEAEQIDELTSSVKSRRDTQVWN